MKLKLFLVLMMFSFSQFSFSLERDEVNSRDSYFVCVVAGHMANKVSTKLAVVDQVKMEAVFHNFNHTKMSFKILYHGWGRWDTYTGGYKARLELDGLLKLSTDNAMRAIGVPGLDSDDLYFRPCTSVNKLNMNQAHEWADKKLEEYARKKR